jgi:hypothetical protein
MPAAPGPGPLAPVHRITIATALAGAVVYAAFEVKLLADGTGGSVVRTLAAVGGAVAIGLYFRNLRGRLAGKLTPHSDR